MNTHEQIEQRDIDIEYEFPQSPEQVWRVLSEPELLAQWLLPNDINTEVGQQFQLEKQSSLIACEVLASEPKRLLSYSWRSDQSAGDLDTVVTFVLTETASGGTHLRLIHSGFAQSTAQIIPLPRRKMPIINSACGVKMLWAA